MVAKVGGVGISIRIHSIPSKRTKGSEIHYIQTPEEERKLGIGYLQSPMKEGRDWDTLDTYPQKNGKKNKQKRQE